MSARLRHEFRFTQKGAGLSQQGSLVVFDRNAASMEALVHVVESQPRFAKAVASWMNAGNLPYIVLGSTGEPVPEFFALAARDLVHLLNDVLSKAATLLSATPECESAASAVDEHLNLRINAAWSGVVACRATPAARPVPRAAQERARTAAYH
jgi:hypothetical protein